MADATSALPEAKETVIASAETAKTDVVKDAVDNVVTRGIDGAKSLLHSLEEKKGEVSSKILGAVSHFTGSADSAATTANGDLPVSTDNQPLLSAGDRGIETATPWWKNCCGVLDLLKS
ncbi:unnamed protein product [Thlaspi arvense]|uniref:Uncharacterized protein n=1 Tax=Thlaspi arvense TaxID=13288 RepID=A0AAU9RDN2_THLAR|nr:unnamed protein product [Thlaspi arvense]